MAGLVLLTAPTERVVSVDELRVHARTENANEDDLLETLIDAATEQAEAFCRRRFVTQTWRATFDGFPAGAILLPRPPLVSVDHVKYLDTAGVEQTLSSALYSVKTGAAPGRVVHAYGTCWPIARNEEDSVRVQYVCGYGAAADVPAGIRQAVLLIAATLYTNRETVAPVAMQPIPHSAEWLLGRYRVVRQAA